MKRLAFLALALALALAAPATADTGQPLGQVLPQRSPAKVYASTCAYCHGHNVGPIILGRKLPVDYIKGMVHAGRNGMPAFRPTEVSPAELDALAVWISKAPKDHKEHGQ
jgi:mono/diheme cytochrome c family protein